MTTVPLPRKSRFGCLSQLLLVALLCGVVAVGVPALITPWGFFMGGRFRALPLWQGWGRLHSNSAGGDYVIYVWFRPDSGRLRGLVYVTGQGALCTPRGEKFVLNLGGDFEKPAGVDTNGKKARFYMFNRSLAHNLLGKDAAPKLELQGRWSNPDLVLDDHGSLARAFTPDATLYPAGTSRPYMGEISPVTLHEGSKAEFDAACAEMKRR